MSNKSPNNRHRVTEGKNIEARRKFFWDISETEKEIIKTEKGVMDL